MGAPSAIAIRNGAGRDPTSKPSDACAVAVVPSPGQAPSPEWVPSREWAPNRERPPSQERPRVPTAIRNGDDRDPTSKPSGACAVAADPSPGRAPNREQATVPTTALEPRGQTACQLDPDQVGPASPPRSQ
jgi:hypothetical protein